MNDCVWVYAVGDDAAPDGVIGLIGLAGRPVRPVTAHGLAAVVGDVPAGEFGQDALRRNLEDLEWLERTARTHHAIIETVAKEHTVVPMRLATVYSSDEAVAGMLEERAADFRAALTRIKGRAEWGVKAYATTQPEQRQSEGGRSEGGRTRTDESGAAYLKRRRAELAARQDTRQQALASADAIYAELGRLAVAARQYPLQSPEMTGRPASMVLNAAYLVPDDRADDFADAVTGLAARHPAVQLALTGPWPPYSFVTQPEPEE
jgi:hypothetical protein